MTNELLIALLSLLGTLSGSLFGVLASNKLMRFRIERLEQKMDKHNNLIERVYAVEARAKSNTHRLDSIEKR